MSDRFSKIIWGEGLTVTDEGDGVIRVDGGGGQGPPGADGADGTGNVSTDALWDALGDLAVGTGPDTADNLGVGADGDVLTADSGEPLGVKWDTPASGAPSGSAGGVLDGTYPNPGLAAGVAGAGLAETSDVLSVNVDGSTLEISSDALRVKDGGITTAKLSFDPATQAEFDARTLTAGSGLSGGGTLAADRTFDVNVDGSTIEINSDTLRVKADGITANEIAAGAVGASEIASTAVTPGSYGDATHAGAFTVDADGRLTAASSVTISASGSAIGEILISDTPSTPLVFADLIQNEAQDDLVYADP